MSKAHLPTLALAGALALTAFAAGAAEQAWVTRSNANAQLLLDAGARHDPEDASRAGVDGYDDRITDLSHDDYAERMADLRATIAEYRKRSAWSKG